MIPPLHRWPAYGKLSAARRDWVMAVAIALAGVAAAGAQDEEPVICREIRGIVWEDVNRNGLREPGEPPVEGVIVNLATDPYTAFTPCSASSPNLSTRTNASGEYRLWTHANVPYRIELPQVAGFWNPQFSYALTRSLVGDDSMIDSDAAEEGEDYGKTEWSPRPTVPVTSGVDIGLVKPLTGGAGGTGWVRGRAFLAQADGTQPQQGGALAGVPVTLWGPGGVLVQSTLTDANGAYAMEAPEGTYRLQFQSPNRRVPAPQRFAGDDPARDSDIDASGFVHPFVLSAGGVVDHLDAGFLSIYDIHFSVWQDLDGNGVREVNEPPIAGITVQRWDETGSAPSEQKVTDTGGSVVFFHTGHPGSFRIRVPTRSVRDSYAPFAAGADPSRDSDVYSEGANAGFTPTITLDPYQPILQAGQAGIVSRPSIQRLITGKVFPADADGLEMAGGSGLGQAGVIVERLDPSTQAVRFVAGVWADSSGRFSIPLTFEGLVMVRLSVSTHSMTGRWQASPRRGSPGGERLANQLSASGSTEWVSLPEGGGWFDVGLGLAEIVPVRGRVWQDANANGVQDAGESGVSGVALTAQSSDYGAQFWESVSDSGGEFEFEVPGTAKLRFGALRPHLDDRFSPRRAGDPTRDSDVFTEGEAIGWTEEFIVPPDGVLPARYDVGLVYAPPPRVTHPLQITAAEWAPDDSFRFLLLGPLGGTYQIETHQRGATPPWVPMGEPFVTTELETIVAPPKTDGPGPFLFRARRLR